MNIIFIAAVALLNIIYMWCIYIINKDKTKLSIKNYLKFSSGAWVGFALSPLVQPFSAGEVVLCMLIGCAVSEALFLFYYNVRAMYEKEVHIPFYDDGSPPKFFITGDKHRHFSKVKDFCRQMNTRRKDVLIILGDTGFNYYDDKRDDELKNEMSELNITFFCLHGNKENRPQNVGTYGIRSFCGGKVYYEPKYSNIYFAIDGEVYTFEGKKYMVVGGAHSVDKLRCLEEGLPYWDDEMPSDETKKKVEERLAESRNEIYGMLTHTCPIDYLPTEMFMSTRQNAAIKRKPRKAKSKKLFKPDIDRSTEIWLGELEKKIDYKVWFCGHYHVDKQIDKINMMHKEIRPLHLPEDDD